MKKTINQERVEEGLDPLPKIVGFDPDSISREDDVFGLELSLEAARTFSRYAAKKLSWDEPS